MRTRKTLCGIGGVVVVIGVLLVAFVGCQGVAIDPAANKALRDKLGNTSVTVFPVVVRSGNDLRYDPKAASTISGAVAAQNLATTRPSDAHVPLTGTWHMNESRIFRESAKSFAEYVKQHPPRTDYALLVEYLIGGKGDVLGVHVYVVDKQGRLAGGYGLNSHQAEFKEQKPQTPEDCTQLVARTIGPQLRRPR